MGGQARRGARPAQLLPVGHRPRARVWMSRCGPGEGNDGARVSAVAPRQPFDSDSDPTPSPRAGRDRPTRPLPRARAHRKLTHSHRGRSGPAQAPGPLHRALGWTGRGAACGQRGEHRPAAPAPSADVTTVAGDWPGKAAAANGRLARDAAPQTSPPRRLSAGSFQDWQAVPGRLRCAPAFPPSRVPGGRSCPRGHRVRDKVRGPLGLGLHGRGWEPRFR